MTIPRFSADSPIEQISAALQGAGCVVVTDLMAPALRQSITDDLAPHMATARIIQDDDPTQFYPGHTRRVSALVTRSASVADELVAHPISQQLCEQHLLPNGEFGYQLHVTAALEVGPGARTQILHREGRFIHFF